MGRVDVGRVGVEVGVTSLGTVTRRLMGLAIGRMGRLTAVLGSRCKVRPTTTTITITTNPTTTNTRTTTRGSSFSMMLGDTNTTGLRIMGTIGRTYNLNLGRTGRVMSNTPDALGRNVPGTSTRTLGGALRRTNTRVRLGWFGSYLANFAMGGPLMRNSLPFYIWGLSADSVGGGG